MTTEELAALFDTPAAANTQEIAVTDEPVAAADLQVTYAASTLPEPCEAGRTVPPACAGGRAAHSSTSVGEDDTSWMDEAIASQKPTVDALFADWRALFKSWPFVNLRVHPRTGEPLLLLGYAFRSLGSDSARLDNCKVDGVVFSQLASLCLPHLRSNDDDSFGVKVVVVAAKEGARLTFWRNVRLSNGSRRPDERHVELVVQQRKLHKYRRTPSK